MNNPLIDTSAAPVHGLGVDRLGFLFALGGTLFFSAKAILIKLAFQHGVHPDVLLMLRMSFGFPFFLLIAVHSTRNALQRPAAGHLVGAMLLGVLGYYVANTLDMYGLQYLPATLERLIIFTYPAMVVMLAVVFTGYRPKPLLMLSIIASYAGLMLVFSDGASIHRVAPEHFRLGVQLVILSALAFACFKFGAGEILRRMPSRIFTAYAMLGASIAISLHYYLRQDVSLLFDQTAVVYAYAASLAAVCTILPAFLIAAAIQRVGAPVASAIGGIGPVMTMLMALVILGETLSPVQLLGSAIIIAAIMSLGRLRQ